MCTITPAGDTKALFLGLKSLAVRQPFRPSYASLVKMVFQPVFGNSKNLSRATPFIHATFKCHAILFSGERLDAWDPTIAELTKLLDPQQFQRDGHYIAGALGVALLGYGSPANLLMHELFPEVKDDAEPDTLVAQLAARADPILEAAQALLERLTDILLARMEDPNILGFMNIVMMMLTCTARSKKVMCHIGPYINWHRLASFLNLLYRVCFNRADRYKEMCVEEALIRPPLPEEISARGLLFAHDILPQWLFEGVEDLSEAEREGLPRSGTLDVERQKQILFWVAGSDCVPWISFDPEERIFIAP